MSAVEAVARLIFDDEHTRGCTPREMPTRQQLDEHWASLPTDLGPDHGVHHYLNRARRYLDAAVTAALDPVIAEYRQEKNTSSPIDQAALGRLIGMEDAARALRGQPR